MPGLAKNVIAGALVGAVLAGAILAGAPGAAMAAGGGSGGMQQRSVENIDPAEEYRAGVAALQTEAYEDAEEAFEKVLKVAPDDPNTNYLMALALIGQDRASRARRYLRKAIRERKDFVEARLSYGLILVDREDLDDAGEQLAALEDILAACGTGCEDDRRALIEGAVTDLRTAIEGGGTEDSQDEARLPIPEHFADNTEGEGAYREAVALINQERFEDAIVLLGRSAEASGPHPDIFNYLGFAHRKLGRVKAARGYYDRALALDPDHRGATEYLGELYLQTGDLDGAKAQLARLDEICAFGCPERDDLAARIAEAAEAP